MQGCVWSPKQMLKQKDHEKYVVSEAGKTFNRSFSSKWKASWVLIVLKVWRRCKCAQGNSAFPHFFTIYHLPSVIEPVHFDTWRRGEFPAAPSGVSVWEARCKEQCWRKALYNPTTMLPSLLNPFSWGTTERQRSATDLRGKTEDKFLSPAGAAETFPHLQ